MTVDLDIDEARIRPEIKRAMDEAFVLIEGVTPGLSVVFASDGLRVYQRDGTYLCVVPLYRLRRPDLDRLWKCSIVALDRFPEVLKDEIGAALNAGVVELAEPPDSDRVQLTVIVDGTRYLLFDAHRSVVVTGWLEGESDVA